MRTKAANAIDMHVGSQIRLRRKSIHITQIMLSERLGITFQQVQKYERGSNRVGASRLQAIANILGVDVGFFFAALTANQGTPPFLDGGENLDLRAFVTSNEGFALNQAFVKIADPLVRRRIIGLVKSLAENPTEPDEDIQASLMKPA